jgi:hypothetical protein
MRQYNVISRLYECNALMSFGRKAKVQLSATDKT